MQHSRKMYKPSLICREIWTQDLLDEIRCVQMIEWFLKAVLNSLKNIQHSMMFSPAACTHFLAQHLSHLDQLSIAVLPQLNLFVKEADFSPAHRLLLCCRFHWIVTFCGFCLCGCSWTVDAHGQTFHLFVPFSLNQRQRRIDLNSSWQYTQIYFLPNADAPAWFAFFFFLIPK